MPKKKQKTPQEKKALSLAKDRWNSYGENDKASRKAIPTRKAEQNKRVRRKAKQDLGLLETDYDEASDLRESSLLHDSERVGGWRKKPDIPLGDILKIRTMRKNRQ